MSDSSTAIALDVAQPWMLWGLIALVPIVWYFVRSLSEFALWQRRASLLVRSLIIVCLVLSLAGLTQLAPSQRKCIVIAIDRSQSIDAQAAELIDRMVNDLREATLTASAKRDGEIELRTMDFASESAATKVISAGAQSESERSALTDEQRLDSNLAKALESAVAAIPPGYVRQVVLLSDGQQTSGDVLQVASRLGVPVDTIPLPSSDEPEVQVAAVSAPAQVKQGEPFYLEVTLASNHETEGFVDVFRGDLLANEASEPVKIGRGTTQLRFQQTIDDERQVDFTVRVRDFTDTLVDNNSASAIVFASGKPTVLLIDAVPEEIDNLKWALEEQGIVVQVRPAEGLPTTLAELQRFDCLMLSNVAATAMSQQQMEIIRTYVQELGGGLVMLGGDQSFSLGGYYKTTLDEILPVRSDFEKDKEKPSLAMVIAFDKSGSMGGQKIELAKDATKAAVELLSPNDQVGVIAFDGASYWVSDVRAAGEKADILDRVSKVEASGGTNLYPALNDAYESLSGVNAKLKHVILMTDGNSTPGDFEGAVRDLVSARITLSTIACGGEADQQLLQELAQMGGGRYYFCEDAQSIPQVFAKETLTASKSAINELPFTPQLVRATSVLNGIDLESAPFLLGNVVTRLKPTSEVVLANDNGEPLLAWWRYGLGMTVAFTSDAKSQWASEWLSWPQFGPFWAQITRHAMRKNDAQSVFVEVIRDDDRARVIVDAVDENGEFINAADTTVTVLDPQLKSQQLQLAQTAPGRYEAELMTPAMGNYNLQISQRRGSESTFQQTRGFVVGYPDELRVAPTNIELLKQISQVSGGRFDPSVSEIVQDDARPARAALPLWPKLLAAAMLLLVIDVALRRIQISRWFGL